jgi:Holliday junction resolvase RusA-like endonuclease
MKRLTYFVPGRPLAFARAGSKGAVRYTPEPQKSYMKQVAWICKEAMLKDEISAFDGPVRMVIHAIFMAPKKRLAGQWKVTKSDLDNITKIQWDSVNGIAFRDDAVVCEMAASKKWGQYEGVTVIIEDLGTG